MRKLLSAFCLLMATVLVTVQTAQAANPDAASIFNSMGGTTTIDRGGSVHTQARSIYSLGGGMTTFQGKKVSLLSADAPSYSAGCNGISWHFGGFAFISLDEIRQLVEAVAQASLGIAVDLAMQTLCPQCYAVMAKLRDMANMMRNAAADACKIAQNMAAMLMKEGGFNPSTTRASDCSKTSAEAGETSSFLDSWAGSACKMLDDAEKKMQKVSDDTMGFLQGGNASGKKADKNMLETTGNMTYRGLSALGFEDGPTKDLWLSMLGMTVVFPATQTADCKEAFKSLTGSASTLSDASATAEEKAFLNTVVNTMNTQEVKSSSATEVTKPSDAKTTTAAPSSGGTTKGPVTCHAPPLLAGIESVSTALMCGVNVSSEMYFFSTSNAFGNKGMAALKATSFGAMCATMLNKDMQDPFVYHCARGAQADCYLPTMQRLSTVMEHGTVNGYSGLVWMIADALYSGAARVKTNMPLDPKTVAVLNGSGWPLYRLINMAAVYPGMAEQLLDAYTAAIAAQYAMTALDGLMKIGAQPGIDLETKGNLSMATVSVIREQIMQMVRLGSVAKTEVLGRLAEKRQLVEMVLQINKTLQAEVIGQGLSGNASLATSIKKAAQPTAAPK